MVKLRCFANDSELETLTAGDAVVVVNNIPWIMFYAGREEDGKYSFVDWSEDHRKRRDEILCLRTERERMRVDADGRIQLGLYTSGFYRKQNQLYSQYAELITRAERVPAPSSD